MTAPTRSLHLSVESEGRGCSTDASARADPNRYEEREHIMRTQAARTPVHTEYHQQTDSEADGQQSTRACRSIASDSSGIVRRALAAAAAASSSGRKLSRQLGSKSGWSSMQPAQGKGLRLGITSS